METVIGMVLAFLLGAYIRQPFALHKKIEVIEQEDEPIDEFIEELLKEESKKEKARQEQMYNVFRWNGKKAKVTDED